MISDHGVRALGACKLRKCAEHKVRAKIRTHFRKTCRETSFEFSLCRTSLFACKMSSDSSWLAVSLKHQTGIAYSTVGRAYDW